jgi:drug/metabolite transporter (DMT)-like permease
MIVRRIFSRGVRLPSLLASSDAPWYLLLPLVSSVLYVAGAMSLKYAARYRPNVWQSAFYTNASFALCSTPLWFGAGPSTADWTTLWQPLLTGFCGLLGQVLTLLALSRGDVSVATPVLGLKVLFVAFFTSIMTALVVEPNLWLAALLSVAGIALLQFRAGERHHDVFWTIILAGLSAMFYGLHDTCVVRWKANWGDWYLPLVFDFMIVGTGLIWLAVRRTVPPLDPRARKSVLGGSFLIGAQGLLLIYTIARSDEPTRVNLVYNARGLWSVLAVWLVGHWYDNTEQHLDRATLQRRFIGAALMLVAIGLAIWK